MNPIKVIKLNIKIIQVMNSCDRKQFIELINNVIDQPDVFKKRYYIWNHIRGKDYYKMMAYYVIHAYDKYLEKCEEISYLDQIETLIRIILDTTKNPAIRKSFIWNIMKQLPILSIDTIQYASPEKIHSILKSDKNVIADSNIAPFIEEVKQLRFKIKELDEEVNMLRTMIE